MKDHYQGLDKGLYFNFDVGIINVEFRFDHERWRPVFDELRQKHSRRDIRDQKRYFTNFSKTPKVKAGASSERRAVTSDNEIFNIGLVNRIGPLMQDNIDTDSNHIERH